MSKPPDVEVAVAGRYLVVSRRIWEELEGPVPTLRFQSDGCSWSPDFAVLLGRRIKLWPACHFHDFAYRTVALTGTGTAGTASGRRQADAHLRANILRLVEMQGGASFRGRMLAWLYWGRVRIYGAGSYNFRAGERPFGFFARVREAWGRGPSSGS